MASTNGTVLGRYAGSSLLNAFTDNQANSDLIQIISGDGKFVVVSVSYNGTVNLNPTAGAGGSGNYTDGRTLVGRFSVPAQAGYSMTVAQAFQYAFPLNQNTLLDMIQVINVGGTVSYYLDYLGVSHGS